MYLTNQIVPPKEKFVDFIKNYPSQTPLVMVNIMKFKTQTADDKSGKEEYSIYGKKIAPLLAKAGGRVIWAGNSMKTVIGDYTTQPDYFAIVYYPSKEAFIKMTTSKEYEAIQHHRHSSLEYGGLIAAETMEE